MAAPKPTIVIVPGAWHVPDHYEPVAKLLRNAGYEVVPLRHPSVSIKSDPGNMLHKDARIVADNLRKVLLEDKDIVVLMHSYGGISGSEAVAMVSEDLRSNPNPTGGRIRRLVFLAAHVLEKGVSFVSSGRSIPNIDINENGMAVHLKPYQRYYADVTREQAEPALAMLQPMAHSALTTATSYAGWRDYGVPSTYIACSQDVGLPTALTDMYISRLKEAGADVGVETLDTSHSPFWSAPEALFEVLQRVIK